LGDPLKERARERERKKKKEDKYPNIERFLAAQVLSKFFKVQ